METAPTDPIPHLSNPLFLHYFTQKEFILILSAFLLGLLVAITLGALRTVVIAVVLLLCVQFPALLTVAVPAVAGWLFFVLRSLWS